MTPEEKISRAKARLIMYQPFFASIVCSMEFSRDDRLPTMGTNGKWIKYNGDFVDSMSLEETLFVLCHEVGHCMFGHMYRRNHRDPLKWNIAGDYVINDLLVSEFAATPNFKATMPALGLHDPALVEKGGGTTDGVYNLLPDNPKGGAPSGGNGTAIDECFDAEGDATQKAEAEANCKVMVAQAAQAAKMAGKLSAKLQRMVEDTLEPVVPWQNVLRRFVASRAKVEYSYERLNTTYLMDDLFVPTMSGEALGEVVVAVDCSGSIGPQELAEFAAEMRSIKEDCKPSAMHVIYFDSEVSFTKSFGKDEELHVEPHGGGGTAFSPIFRKVQELGHEPQCCIVLTDLHCSDFGPSPAYPTLWVTTCATEAPWGEVIKMNRGT